MAEQVPAGNIEARTLHWLSPFLHTLTPRHARIYRRYQDFRTLIDFGAASCFVAGSVLFLYPDTGSLSGRLFIIGSVLFAVKPTIDLVRGFHLRKIDVVVQQDE